MSRLQQLWRYLLRGSDVQYLPRTWLADTERLAHYEAWTKRQWQQGAVVKDTDVARQVLGAARAAAPGPAGAAAGARRAHEPADI